MSTTNNKILVLTNDWGGLHSFRKEVFEAFRELGYEVYISSPSGKNIAKSEWFINIGCKVIETKFKRHGTNPIADAKLVFTYKKIIKQINPIAVLTYTIKPNVYGGMACAICGVPQIANITGLGAAVEYPGLMQKITIGLYKLGMRRTRVTFFQNETNRNFCIKHGMVNKNNTQIIPGSGVNLSYHSFQDYPKEHEPIRFVFCSRIRKEKGIEEFLTTAIAIKAKYPNTEFHVLGGCEGDYESRLHELQNDGIISYHGRQADVRPYFAKGYCTIHPSFYPEGMSNVLLESCATGRPIITTDRAGCREVVDDGINGYVVKQQDSKDLLDKVERFILLTYEEKKAMGLAARRKVEREFDRKIVVNAYVRAVQNLQCK